MHRRMTAWLVLIVATFVTIAGPSFAQGAGSLTGSQNASDSSGQASEPSLDDLIAILENENTRAKLLESLKAAAYQAPQASETPQETAVQEVTQTLPGQIADAVRSFIGSASDTGQEVLDSVDSSMTMLSGAGSIDRLERHRMRCL